MIEKRMMRSVALLIGLAVMLVSFGCFDEMPPLPPTVPELSTDTSYVQITPSFGGFTRPEDVIIGNDQLLYVADTYGGVAGRVVMLNRAGQVLSAASMLRPISVAQDGRLDLLVGGTVLTANGDTAGALFRVHVREADHDLAVARIDTIWRELARPARRFPGITIFGDNTYLVVRDGPDNSSSIDPDALVLQFDDNDRFITPVASLTTRSGSGITDIYHPTSIASFSGVKDFVITQSSEPNQVYGAIWLYYQNTPEFEGWLPRFDPARTEDRGRDFIRARRFSRPEAVTIDRSRRDIFIADAALDSIIKFNSRGSFKSESFGKVKSGGVLQDPSGLAYFGFQERILYVLDRTRGELLRFRLTTDAPR